MLKITDKQKKEAIEIGRKHKVDVIFVNDKGEYFTEENFANNSVGGDKEKYGKVEVIAEVVKETGTNELGKVEDVLAVIEAATGKKAVEAILNAENAGKKRVTVIDASTKKLEILNQSE